MRESEHPDEMDRRALAVEGALLQLVDSLAARGVISADEAEEMLNVLSRSSDRSAARASASLRFVGQLRRLRAGNGKIAPGA